MVLVMQSVLCVHATNAVLPQSFTEEQIQTVIDAATEGQVPTYSATQTTTSGTSVTFTDVPSWARKITVMFQGVSHSSGSNKTLRVRLGTDSGTITSGYDSLGGAVAAGSTDVETTDLSFQMKNVNSGGKITGHMMITKFDSSTYIQSHAAGALGSSSSRSGGGELTGVTEPITSVVIFFGTSPGSVNFDAGKIRLLYE